MLRDDNASGLSFAIIANAFFVLNCCLTHVAIDYYVDMASMLLIGSVVKFAFAHIQLKKNGLDYDLRMNRDTGLVAMCQLLNTPSYLLFMIALKYISVRFAMVLENLGPLVVALLSYCCLKEKTSVTELANMAVCFGVVVLMTFSGGQEEAVSSFWDLVVGISLTLVSLVMFSGTYVINRFLRDANAVVINAQNMLFSMLISFVLFAATGVLNRHSLLQTVVFGGVNGLFGFFCSLTFIMASQLQPASRIASLDFSQVPMGFLLDYFAFKQHINAIEMICCGVICALGAFVFSVAYKEQRLTHSEASTDDLEVPLISISSEENDFPEKIKYPQYRLL